MNANEARPHVAAAPPSFSILRFGGKQRFAFGD
jgi:hypothetical protein